MSLDFENNSPVIRSMMGASCNVNEVSVVVFSLMFSEGLMDSGVNEFFMMLFLAERQHKIPISNELLFVFEMHLSVFFHGCLDF